MKIKLGVIFGGNTVEHEVSVISAVQAMNHMNQEKYDIIPFYVAKDRTIYCGKMLMDIELYKDMDLLKRYAKKCVLFHKEGKCYAQSLGFMKKIITDIDIMFPIVHGNNAEDGTIQGFLENLGIPYVGSHVMGSALGQDKVLMKQVFASNNLPIVPYIWFFDNEYTLNKSEIENKVKELGFPVVVKPATLGSSVGIEIVKSIEKLDDAILEAIKYDTKIVIEKAVSSLVEVNASVVGNYEECSVSAIEEVMGSDEILSYRDKYLGGGKTSKGMASTGRIIPARIEDSLKEEIIEYSKAVFRVLNLSGVCRIDYLIDQKENKVYINEPNTIPGSLSFYLWEPVGIKYEELLDMVINIAIKDYRKKMKKIYSFDTNILSNFNGLKGGKGMKGKLNR